MDRDKQKFYNAGVTVLEQNIEQRFVATARSSTMAKRISNALNIYRPKGTSRKHTDAFATCGALSSAIDGVGQHVCIKERGHSSKERHRSRSGVCWS
jgi:hypothetical protein